MILVEVKPGPPQSMLLRYGRVAITLRITVVVGHALWSRDEGAVYWEPIQMELPLVRCKLYPRLLTISHDSDPLYSQIAGPQMGRYMAFTYQTK